MDSATLGQSQSQPHFRFFEIYSSTVQTSDTDDVSDEAPSKITRPKSLDVYADLIIVFKYKQPAKGVSKPEYEQKTLKAYEDVLLKLTRVGLQYETRPSGNDTLFIFVLCPWAVLKREATRNSIHDWLAGIKVADTAETEQLLQPAKARDQSLDTLSDADRMRLVNDLITGQPAEGGAGIYPGEHEYVESILPLHDKAFNKLWLKSWSTKWIVNQDDLSKIRNHFGEKVAYYFEFLQFYFQWLAAPTALGVFIHFFGSSFSIFYGVCVILWSVVFTECWKRREKELALWWSVRHVSKTEMKRPSFKGDTLALDPVTGEMVPQFSPWKRWSRRVAGLPVILGGALALAAVITAVFGIEVFFTIYYDGYLKEILIYVPMVLYSLAIPNVAAICKSVSLQLTDYENYETHASHEYHLMQKVFIFNALTSYMSILLTAYIYIPFGPQVISTFQSYGLSFSSATIDPSMLQTRLKAFMITTQAVSFATETIVPWLTRRAMTGAVKLQKEVSEKISHESAPSDSPVVDGNDSEEAKKFLKRVQKQSDLPVYDVNEDYAEMVLQFGYVSLFSVIWPLTGLCAFINNWVELRSDAAKISYNARRPIPSRTDSIGPWLDNLHNITWFSSLTNASILYLFHGADGHGPRLSFGMLLMWLLVSEHAYMGLRSAVGLALDSIPTQAELNVRKKEFGVKSSWLSRLSAAISVNDLTTRALAADAAASEGSGSVGAQFENDIGVQAIQANLKTN
ncbi:calcium-activated chloride channel-domain-containing protein [Dissophora ornata]|nr:hypothetical protein BGZ58_000509 [Dissophora ornata]KAI8596531.1 calcium-activated chloride channel-domain-containing protein [Dissophora ornata]